MKDIDRLIDEKGFYEALPFVVQEILSPEGLEVYSPTVRQNLFQEGLSGHSNDIIYPGQRYTHFDALWSHVHNKRSSIHREEPLIRSVIASLILLGLSLPDEGTTLVSFPNFAGNDEVNNYRQHLGHLLALTNATRRWILDNHLDVSSGHAWDQSIAEIYLNLPRHRIDPTENTPKDLPQIFREDLSRLYSTQTADILLDYAQVFAHNLPLNSARSRQLIDFQIEIRRFPRDYVMRESTQQALIDIQQQVNPNLRSSTSSNVLKAGEFLPKPPRIPERFRWLHNDVKKLLD